MTVLEVIQKSSEFLAKKGVESARLQTELLLAHALKLPRMKLYLNFERKLSEAELGTVRELVKRRSQREPLQHIIGSTSFCGLEMAVNRHVLVPRPETELLAEMGWEWLGKHSTSNIQHPTSNERYDPVATVLDFGTGSGCIAIALAMKCPSARVVALDVSADALTVAKQNAERNGVSGRIEFCCGDGFEALGHIQENDANQSVSSLSSPKGGEGRGEEAQLSPTQIPSPRPSPCLGGEREVDTAREQLQFDLIVSNPPYIPSAEIESLQPEVRDFDPRAALDGGADGLNFYRMFAAQAQQFLKPEGKIMLEFGDGQAEEIKRIFESQKWVVEAVREDYTRRQRILVARRH